MADDGMQLASVRNGNSYVQMALHARPVSACEDKKLHGKNGNKHLEGEGRGGKTACLKVTTCQDG